MEQFVAIYCFVGFIILVVDILSVDRPYGFDMFDMLAVWIGWPYFIYLFIKEEIK